MKLNWILLSLIAVFCFSIMVTLISVVTKKGVPLSFVLFGLFLIGAVAYFIQTLVTTNFKFELNWMTISLIILMGVLSFIGNLAQFQASTTAPNPGLAMAVVSFQSVFIGILAFIFFKDKISLPQLLGMILTLAGIITISLGSKPAAQNLETKNELTSEVR